MHRVFTQCRMSHWCYFTRSHSDRIEKNKALALKGMKQSLFALYLMLKIMTSNEMWVNQVELRLRYSALPRSCVGRVITWCCDSSMYDFKGPAMLSQGPALHSSCLWTNASLKKSDTGLVLPCMECYTSPFTVLSVWNLSYSDPMLCCSMCCVDQLGLLNLCFDLNKPGLAVSWVSVWHSDNLSSMVLLGNAVMIMMLDRPLFPPIHTCLCHLLGMLLAPWPCRAEMLYCALDCGY